ncbi:unnamed protein product [Leptosia nina]|uniref:Uncharacterized protein n=1 Tax=Leptosia nina TaxID=320188 RepID=A0AAV1JWJ4_9NEOP
MKILIFLTFIAFAKGNFILLNSTYTTADDHADIEGIMDDPEAVKFYMDCFVGRRICEPYSFSYKKNMAEAIPTQCKRCNMPQKYMWTVFLKRLKSEYPTEYLAFQQMYDPKKKYMDDFIKAVSDAVKNDNGNDNDGNDQNHNDDNNNDNNNNDNNNNNNNNNSNCTCHCPILNV